MTDMSRTGTRDVPVVDRFGHRLLRQAYTLNIYHGVMASRPTAKAYRFRLSGSDGWLLFVGAARSKGEARRVLTSMFGERVREVRVHPLCDPFATPERRRLQVQPLDD